MAAKKLAPGTPFAPVDWKDADALALQALVRGTADPAQQKRAIDWVIMQAAGTYDMHYHPSERDTAFALGRAFVGQQIRKLLSVDPTRLVRGGKPDVEDVSTTRAG